MIKNLYVSGYRNYEMGIFKADDERLYYIKKALRQAITRYAMEGLEWVLISGELGVEMWTANVVHELQDEFPHLHYAVIMPYAGFGEKWNERNRQQQQKVLQEADYVDYSSKHPYQNPGQLKANQVFLINSSDAALLLYEPEYQGKTQYVYDLILLKQERNSYALECITQFDLQDLVEQENLDE